MSPTPVAVALPAASTFARSRLIASFITAALFGVGLVVAGMTKPSKVVGFLDPFGQWDPSLAFVMLSAIGVHAVLYRVVRKRSSPLFDLRFHVPGQNPIDRRLLIGAALFGAGWGLAGICPGPGLVAAAGDGLDGSLSSILLFVVAMLAGMGAFSAFDRWQKANHAKRVKAADVCPG